MKKLFVSVLSAAMLTTSPMVISTAGAGVPVFDATAYVRQFQELMELQKQYELQYKQFQQLTKKSNVSGWFSDFSSDLPTDMQRMYRDYQNGNWSGLATKIEQLKKARSLNGLTKSQSESINKMLGDQRFKTLENVVKLDQMFKESNRRFSDIQRLINRVNHTRNPKEAADLGNRIQAEIAFIEVQSQQIQLMAMRRAAEKDMQQEQRQERSRSFNNPNNTKRLGSTRAFSK